MAWMVWDMRYGLSALGNVHGLGALGYDLWPECFGI